MAVGDFWNSGDEDIVMFICGVVVWCSAARRCEPLLGNGDGTYARLQTETHPVTGDGPDDGLVDGYFNGDGDLDPAWTPTTAAC